ncbi:MAG: glycoside hydrolase family 3 protein [Lachnospiraceae bacterium]|nr:glycoside hydrolase family 3 protein [Lachnospiraceae bacterium]
MKKTLDYEKYAKKIREVSASGCVLLKNDSAALPYKEGMKLAVFGRSQMNYYNAGAGSGGMVNVPYVVSIPQGLKDSGVVSVDEQLSSIYEEWIKDHPFDEGTGWATEPFYQEEMPLDEDVVAEAAKRCDAAIFIIGRMAGEDKDALAEKGSFYLLDEEEKVLAMMCAHFDNTLVLINAGAIMDMSWVEKYDPRAVMYVWQGGMEGGNAVADLLTGKVNPSGRLADTIALELSDYPAHDHFGDEKRNHYVEDIYTGYRYFETVAKDKVLYPFGYGLSYTRFKSEGTGVSLSCFDGKPDVLTVHLRCENTGNMAGRNAVQVYVKAPEGALDKPARVLVAFHKFEIIEPGDIKNTTLKIPVSVFASFDDGGYTGNKNSFVLEQGEYKVYAGDNVRDAKECGSFFLEETCVCETVKSDVSPVMPFKRLHIEDGQIMQQDVPLKHFDRETTKKYIDENVASALPYAGDKGIKLADVRDGKASLDEFLSQIADEELICITRMEGVYSPRAKDGTMGAFGGITDKLQAFGIPVACLSDGPSGIRLDDGSMACSLPSGTLMACSFDTKSVRELYEYEGLELTFNEVDNLLGPGINIHRYPLNGRNFEYFSEDPLLTGLMAAAQIQGLKAGGADGTIKHFCANNQEKMRTKIDSVVSHRALREIYLRPFEYAVRQGGADSVMTTYGKLNGTYTAGHSQLLTGVLRNDWGFEGVVMTDWWAMIDDELYDESDPAYKDVPEYKSEGTMKNGGPMLRAQNDLYSVHACSEKNTGNDNTAQWLKAGLISRDILVRTAKNICLYILNRERLFGDISVEAVNMPAYDSKDKNRRIAAELQSPPPGNV